ncbi:family 16 glycoside hydrolase [Actinoplanes sp. DH11]|uniref:family 16 glycoside hydrolase n=1 Tax=Actinoplanes sp. DH11 TaxID=2857011 RepID=UPI001E41D984|nr:family 16 glycoside hydrolase [Actinoplanes sp. DH11]
MKRLVLLSAAVLAGALLPVLPTSPATAAVPPQEPGVTLRTFDLQATRDRLCTLKAGQTPNVDKLMPVINWTATADFGLADHFQSEVTGNLNITTAGAHQFRLTSDDGSRLAIDNATVIDHDGLHGATAKEGGATLTAGYHALRLDYFDQGGGKQLTLEWRPPGATAFTVIPTSALSTDAGVVRVTAPGRKECESAGDSPGDGLPLAAVHPGYTLTNLRPSGFQPQVSAMDWFPDGRLAIATWGGSDTSTGEVYILSGVTGSTSPSQVTQRRIATGLREPMGLKIVDGKIYVSQKHELTELNDTTGDGVIDQYRRVATWPFGGNFHEFAFGLLYRDGFFYLNLSVSINLGGATTEPQPAANRGTTLKINRSTGAVEYLAGGLRTPNGLGFGPEGDIFVTDNQGGWLPASKLVQVKPNRFFGHYTNPDGPFDSQPVTQPVLWLPQNEIANSPSTPLMLDAGPYAGQMVFGDVTYGGVQRAFLEKVGGQYQGAVFRLTQGLEMGVLRLSQGPDGALYAGGLGAGGNWGQPGKLQYGLQKLTPNGTSVFDIKAMRAVADGFELEYTQPVSTTTAAQLAARYRATQWRYVSTPAYGGPKVDEETLPVTSATLSADRLKVTLKVAGLKPGRVVHVRSPRPFTSTSGASLWSTEAWYTLNSLADGTTLRSDRVEAENSGLSGTAGVATDHTGYTGTGFVAGYGSAGAATTFTVNVPSAGSYPVSLRFSNGPNPSAGAKTVSLYVNGTKVRQVSLADTGNWDTWANQTDTVTLRAGGNTIAYRVDTGDVGHVNLDSLTVGTTTAPGGGPRTGTISGLAGKCVDVDNAGTADKTKIQLYTCNNSSAQSWTRVGDTLRALGKCLDIDNAGTANGTKVQLYTCNGSAAQVWQQQPNGSLLNPQSGKVLDVAGGASANGTQIQIWEWSDVAQQRWTHNGTSRVTLFDGGGLGAFQTTGGTAATWPVSGGSAEVLGGDIRTKQAYGDFKLHVEFWLPNLPADVTGQARANSGIYLQDRYEVQVLDSYGKPSPALDDAAAIYQKRAPSTNAATAPETWQTYDITFRAARWNGAAKTENARVTVVWNGQVVHNDVAIDGPTGGGAAESPDLLPIRLQDHGDPGANVRYRNIWIEPA